MPWFELPWLAAPTIWWDVIYVGVVRDCEVDDIDFSRHMTSLGYHFGLGRMHMYFTCETQHTLLILEFLFCFLYNIIFNDTILIFATHDDRVSVAILVSDR